MLNPVQRRALLIPGLVHIATVFFLFFGGLVLFQITAENLDGFKGENYPFFENSDPSTYPLLALGIIGLLGPFSTGLWFSHVRVGILIPQEQPFVRYTLFTLHFLAAAACILMLERLTYAELFAQSEAEALQAKMQTGLHSYYTLLALDAEHLIVGLWILFKRPALPSWLGWVMVILAIVALPLILIIPNPDAHPVRLFGGGFVMGMEIEFWIFYLWLGFTGEDSTQILDRVTS